jgi:small subunit ribosomal protein S27Ae
MPKRKKKKTERVKKGTQYAVIGGKLERKNQCCPKCGPGVSMAEHKDRLHCGKCGYTNMKNVKPHDAP